MSDDAKIYAGQWGHSHTITVQDEDGAVVDVSTATTLEMMFRPKRGELITVTASLVGDGTDGRIRYKVTDGDAVDATGGTWSRWARVEWADGEYPSTPERYYVHTPGT